MERWLSTAEAADRLGTSLATVRALVRSGQLQGTVEDRNVRKRWRVDADSVEVYLAQHGRVDQRRMSASARAAARRDNAQALAEQISMLLGELRQRPSVREHCEAGAKDSEYRAQFIALTEVVLHQRARSQAIEEAERHQATAVEHLTAAVKAQSEAAAALRRALAQADDALGELLIPGVIPSARPD